MTPTPIAGSILSLGFLMSETNPKTQTNKVATREYFIDPTLAADYLAATSAALRDSTTVGGFITAIQALSKGVLKTIDVGTRFDTALAPPASTVGAFDFDQFLISARDVVTTDPVKTSIPARNMAAVVPESNGVSIPIGTGAMATFVTAYQSIALSGDDNAISVLRALISK